MSWSCTLFEGDMTPAGDFSLELIWDDTGILEAMCTDERGKTVDFGREISGLTRAITSWNWSDED